MKKFLLPFLLLILNFNQLYSQWNTVNVGTTQDLYSVDYYSLNDTWIGSFNQIVKTSNGGTNWSIINPVKDSYNGPIPGNMYDLALTSATNAIGTGLFFTGNTECILTTSDAGLDWSLATTNNTVPLLRYIRSVDVFSTNAVAVGNNGRIAISNNSGSTWNFVNSGTTVLINDVKFASVDTVFAVGNNTILKSVNGGANWINTSINGNFTTVSCKRNVIYIASGSQTLLKSTNYGTSYSTINLPFYCGIIYALSKDTLIASGSSGLCISKTGGQYWEKYILPSHGSINMIDFLTPDKGIAVGDAGYVIKTNNLSGAPTAPISSFTIQGGGSTFCLGDSITFINSTAALSGYSYKWKINGSQFSTQYNSGIRLNTVGTQTIYLIVNNNSGGADTTKTQINVLGHLINPGIFSASTDSVCSGNMVDFAVLNSLTGVDYQLRQGFSAIGAAQSGTGGTLNFAYPSGITGTTSFNIKAVKTNSCFTDSIIQNKSIYLYSSSGSPSTACTPTASLCPNAGITNVSFNTINNTTTDLINRYFDYSCCKQTTVTEGNIYPISVTTTGAGGEFIWVWIDYNNDGVFNNSNELVYTGLSNHTATANITIDTTFWFNTKLRMRVGSAHDNTGMFSLSNPCSNSFCGQMEDYAVTIVPGHFAPTPNFRKVATAGCSTSVAFTNTSYNAISYSWDFGDGSVTSTVQTPTHVYTVSGNHTISLTACNSYGCNTSTQVINIIIPQVPVAAICTPNTVNGYAGPLYKFKVDTIYDPNGVFWNSTYPNGTNLTCLNQLHVHAASTYYFSFILDSYSQSRSLGLFIDYNNNGIFDPYDYVNYFGGGWPMYRAYSGSTYQPIFVQIPETVVQNTPLRMRVMVYDESYQGSIMDGCGSGNGVVPGYYHDYTIFIEPPIPCTANFTVYSTTACTSVSIGFTNSSVNASHYLWDFGDGTTDTVASQIDHHYASPGVYTVKLKVSNGLFSDSLTRTNYITIKQALPVPVITLSGNQLSTTAVASYYQWYKDYSLITGATSPSYTLTGDGTYYLEITNSNWCTTLSSYYSYYPIRASFTLGSTTGCSDSTLVYFNNNSSNATSYTIKWGDGNSMTYNGTGGPYHYYHPGTYTVKLIACNDSSICDSTSLLYTYSNDVWPGDADASFRVDNNDLLPIGLYYGQAGPPRASISNLWQAYPDTCWGTLQFNGNELKHADCNGDGIIDANDTLAINLNFNLTHAIPIINTNYNERTLDGFYFVTNGNSFNHGDWVDAQLWMGSSSNLISNLYGVAFNIHYDAALVQAGTESISYPVSWLGTPGTDVLKIAKVDALANTAYGAITRMDQTNANGFGKIADFKFQVKTSLTSAATMHLSVSNYKANDAIGLSQVFNTINDSVRINAGTVGVTEQNILTGFTISPNPFNLQTTIIFNEEQKNIRIKITDVIGKEVKSIDFNGKELTLEKGEMKEGIYFLQIIDENKNVVNRKIVVE